MLYRKFRPQNFKEIIGQDHITNILKQSVLEANHAHAYLFSGPRGTGKTSTARILAKALNCSNSDDGEPCNKCDNCVAISQGRFIDLIEIDAASNRGIEEIRTIKDNIGFLPVEGRFKVYIIDEVHMLTNEAFNALLKTLEEPPQNVVFILATTEIQKVPVTIMSRTQRFDFLLGETDSIAIKLETILDAEGYSYDRNFVEFIANAGTGSYRDAETILDKVISSLSPGSKTINIDQAEKALGYINQESINTLIKNIYDGLSLEALQIIDNLIASGINLTQLVRQLIEEARQAMVRNVEQNEVNGIKRWMQIIKILNQAAYDMKLSLMPRVNLEIGILDLMTQNSNSSIPKATVTLKTERNSKSTKQESISKTISKPNNNETTLQNEKIDEVKIDFDQIVLKWHDVLEKSKTLNHHLAAFLGSAELNEGNNQTLIIKVRFSMHRDRINEPETRKKLQEIFKEVYGHRLNYECIIEKKEIKKDEKEPLKGNLDLVEEIFA